MEAHPVVIIGTQYMRMNNLSSYIVVIENYE
jgi:hypothetical protein